MNLKQKICFCVGPLFVIGMLLYPPVYITVGDLRYYAGVEDAEFTTNITVFMSIPKLFAESRYRDINWKCLMLELVIAILAVLCLSYLMKTKKK